MLRGHVLFPDGTSEPISTIEQVRVAAAREGARLWIDLEAPTAQPLQELGAVFGLDDDAITDCIEGEQRARIDEFEGYVFVVVYGAVGPGPIEYFRPRKLAIFFCERFLITVHAEALRSVNAQLKRCEKRPESILGQGLDYIFYSILDSVVDNYGLVAEEYEKRLDELEDRSLATQGDGQLLEDLIGLRRELLELRRVASSQRELLMPIAEGQLDDVSDALEARFSHVRDHLTTTLELIDSHREILHGIRENYNLWLSNRLNEVMKVLTIFASFFLPLSLIAGIYGMNTPLWPDPTSPWTFWFILGLMGFMAAGMLAYFHHKKWF